MVLICPKCKTKVSSEDAICPNCKLRLIFKCPRCGSSTRLGSVSCKKCGYTFVKFCPQCHSANYATSSICRKCNYHFENSEEKALEEQVATQPPQEEIEKKQDKVKRTLICYIDFINLDKIFEKYNTEEFQQKVVDNIKTTVKLAFNKDCDFASKERFIKFNIDFGPTTKLLERFEKFDQEITKFNQILEKTLDCGVSYKYAIITEREFKNDDITQLKIGSDKDCIVSNGAYLLLNNELSLVKISPDSYKMIFLDQKQALDQEQDYEYDKAIEVIMDNLAQADSEMRAISINAPRGAGKTYLLNDLYNKINKIKTQNTVVFYAGCSALTQVSPYGLIQSFFVSLFECPTVIDGEFNLKDFEKKVLEKLNLAHIDPENLETLANLIYPIKKDYFENILINKEITYKYLKDIFNYVKQRKNVIFIIDDFDIIDESSFGFLKHLVDEGYFERDAKMILGYKNRHSVAMYFQSGKLSSDNCLNISLKSFNSSDCKNFIKQNLGDSIHLPDEVFSQISFNAQGNIAYIEQILEYMFEKKYLFIKDKTVCFNPDASDIELPATLEDCFYNRLDFLKEQNQKEYSFLMIASLLGDRVDYKILSKLFELQEDEFFDIVKSLEKKGYLKPKLNDTYGFKNSLTWSYCYIRAKEEDIIKDLAKKLLGDLNGKILSTPLICPILAQIIDDKDLAFKLWTKNLQYANYIGDVNIYSMAQKQSLILLENVKLDNFEYTKNNICERLGKLNYKKSPKEAKDYLTNAIVAAQRNGDINKIVDLSGYLVKSLYIIQDYTGVVEIVDNVVKYFKNDETEKRSTLELELALIQTRKLEAMLALGSWEAISNLVNAELNPIFQRNLTFFGRNKNISQGEIFYAWIESNIILAQSYCEQGSPLAFGLIDDLEGILSKEKGQKIDTLKIRLAYVNAIANTSRGYFDESDLTLQEVAKDYPYIIENPKMVCKWNLVNIINKILRSDLDTVKDELFEITAYANNCGDETTKNILKTLLAYVYLQEKNYLKAIEIATSQMQYFSSKKIAFGALLAWYISAAATANNKTDTYCIEICEKAVKICENAQNNNFYFKIMFQELLSATYLKLNDKESAQMYCDLALQAANSNELLYLQVRLNDLKANIAREKINSQNDKDKPRYAQNVIRQYSRTLDMANRLNLKADIKRIEKELTSFKAHCQLNRILEG